MIERGGNGEGGFGFVELLESGDVDVDGFLNWEEEAEDENKKKIVRLPTPQMSSISSCTPFACYNSSGRMIYFGGEEEDGFVNGFPMNPNVKCGNETSFTTSSSSGNTSHSKHKEKGVNLSAAAAGGGNRGRTAIAAGIQKKPRKEQEQTKNSAVKKEKLSDRIIKLQQLVSPFGKRLVAVRYLSSGSTAYLQSDTASVLHEALCYIKFLHDQVQVLSSPYLQQLPSSAATLQVVDMRSRGLCLVPTARIAQVAGTNGADLWSPVMGNTACDVDSKH